MHRMEGEWPARHSENVTVGSESAAESRMVFKNVSCCGQLCHSQE